MSSTTRALESVQEESVFLDAEVEDIIDRALAEDVGAGDATTDPLIPANLIASGTLVAKAEGVLAGVEVALAVFRRVHQRIQTRAHLADGACLKPGAAIADIQGPMAGILRAERVALNFVQHLSGIATETNRYVEAVKDLPVRIVDTRKTLPGLRALQKYAVRVGGGINHRQNLADGILIKDNHIAALARQGLSARDVIQRARERCSHMLKVEVEVETVEQAREAVEGGADVVMLDNMPLEEMRRAVDLCRGRVLVEASGGITLDTVRAIAEIGVDIISVGAVTHSARALDISLDVAV